MTNPIAVIENKKDIIHHFGWQEWNKVVGRGPNDIGDLGQILPLAASDMLNALNAREDVSDDELLSEIFQEDIYTEELQEFSEIMFFTVLGALFAGGTFALISSKLRAGQLRAEYDELKNLQSKSEESEKIRQAKKTNIINLIKKYKPSFFMQQALYKRLRKSIPNLDERLQAVIDENDFQRGKWKIFGASQVLLAVGATIALSIAVGVFAKDIILLMTIMAPLISLILTVSMGFMAHRFSQKWQEAKQKVEAKQKEFDEITTNIDNIELQKESIIEQSKGNTDANHQLQLLIKYCELDALQKSLKTKKDDLAIELDCLKHHERQRHIKFGLYTAATVVSAAATLVGLAFAAVGFTVAAPFIAPILGIVSASLVVAVSLLLVIYLGYNLAQLLMVHYAKNELKKSIQTIQQTVPSDTTAITDRTDSSSSSNSTSATNKPATTLWHKAAMFGSTIKAVLLPPPTITFTSKIT